MQYWFQKQYSRYRRAGNVLSALVPWRVPKVLIDRENGYDPRVERPHQNLYLTGYWQAAGYFADIADTLRKEFDFKVAPDAENTKMIEKIIGCNSVCVHIRRGDFQYTANGMFRLIEPSYYRAAINIIHERVSQPRFFIFSNDPEWARENLAWCPDAEFVSFNVGKQDHEDLRLMMYCRHFVIPNSTFSWWGAWLGADPEKVVVVPRHWYTRCPPSPRDIILDSWVAL
jgi:hypothetical protein